MPYDKTATLAARFTQGPALEKLSTTQARETAANVFEVHWKEPKGAATVTHVEDYNRQACPRDPYRHRPCYPSGRHLIAFDLANRLDNPRTVPGWKSRGERQFPVLLLLRDDEPEPCIQEGLGRQNAHARL